MMVSRTASLLVVFLCISAVKMETEAEKEAKKAYQDNLDFQCYVCNSHEVDFCDDPFDKSVNGTGSPYITNCHKYLATRKNKKGHPIQPPPENSTYFCRKTLQTINGVGPLEDIRVVRTCSWVEGRFAHRDCYNTANQLYTTRVCKCLSPDCNPAATVTSSIVTVLIPTVMVILKLV